MKKQKKNSFLEKLKHPYRWVVLNDHTLEERVSIKLTRLNLISIVVASLVVLFIGFLFLVGYTSLSEYVPGKSSHEMRKEIFSLSMKADSLEKIAEQNALYLLNINAIVQGKDPVNFVSTKYDSSKTPIATSDLDFTPSKDDSLLRATIATEDKVSIKKTDKTISLNLQNTLFFCPLNGIVVKKFSVKTGFFGIDISAKKNSPVKSIYNGVVVFSNWDYENEYTIGVQHDNGILSLYTNNSALFKKPGDVVKAGEVISMLGSSNKQNKKSFLHFELWHQGIPLNPEIYIAF